jgi:hypothetical protein
LELATNPISLLKGGCSDSHLQHLDSDSSQQPASLSKQQHLDSDSSQPPDSLSLHQHLDSDNRQRPASDSHQQHLDSDSSHPPASHSHYQLDSDNQHRQDLVSSEDLLPKGVIKLEA